MKIAFVHYPHEANSARLETMPFALNSVLKLAETGFEVDLFLWENINVNYSKLFPKNVVIKYFNNTSEQNIIKRVLNRDKIRPNFLKYQFKFSKKYDCAFGLGQIGAYIASIISTNSRCPFIYFNDEFPSCWGNSIWSKLEKEAVKKAILIVVPDHQRFSPLAKELNILEKPYVELPNIPFGKPIEIINWHEKLNIPKNYFPFLHAGSVADWSQIPEILSSLPNWPDNTMLIIHSRSKEGMLNYRKQLSHLDNPARVIWSFEPLENEYLDSLVSYCVANFALYRNSGPNIDFIGFSSGKIMRSLVNSSPVIASDLKSLKFIEEFQLGILVRHPAEIHKAIENIIQNREIYSNNCIEFCNVQTNFSKSWDIFCSDIYNLTGLSFKTTY